MSIKYYLKQDGNKLILCVDFTESEITGDIASDERAMAKVIELLQEYPDVSRVVVKDFFSKDYKEEGIEYLKEIASVISELSKKKIWSYSYLFENDATCYKVFGQAHNFLTYLVNELLPRNPVMGYFELLKEIERVGFDIKSGRVELPIACLERYFNVLMEVKNELEKTKLINFIKKNEISLEDPSDRTIYSILLTFNLKSEFIDVELEEFQKNLELITTYRFYDYEVSIYRSGESIDYYYYLDLPEMNLSLEEYVVYSKLMDTIAKGRASARYFIDPYRARKHFQRIYFGMALDIAEKKQIKLTEEQLDKIAKIVVRYTLGYGAIEPLLYDSKITDIYIDSPVSQNNVYIVHADYGECVTNIRLTENFLNKLSSKLRASSGRPFDEAHPVLDTEIKEPFTRVAGITRPLAPDGTAFALRKHRMNPWTYPLFIKNKMISPEAAALLSLLVEYNSAIIICGSRGAGKTSLLGASMLEILPKYRVITIEDTLELPVEYLKNIGYKIQRLKTRSAISRDSEDSYELTAAEALRTALRLGDSVLIVGEVRSLEAKELFEAMRVGTAGYSVMGTIHGENAYSVWDRIVNDLGIPSTQFKATDVIVVARPLRFKGSLKKYRRVVSITEVKKLWKEDPMAEDGFYDIMTYHIDKDKLIFDQDFIEKSELLAKIMKYTGFSKEDILNEIESRAKMLLTMVTVSEKLGKPELLEGNNVSRAKNKYILLSEKQREENGFIDYGQLFEDWKDWYINKFVKNMISVKNER